ncbi:ATP-binding protein [Bradyrhizobium diazoefficiens]|uniref:AlbA family DNA-binding domain-containing protein n=1 Tax=Bradyrhizobium diazoefficiens TaxID=1355477 RepID=UPI00190A1046|nr:ATP-binding protein [Bradyrhizobium diazoefficiens]QQO14020.1 ATP-binding protein [Bradyrhizobium diazoefficiens]
MKRKVRIAVGVIVFLAMIPDDDQLRALVTRPGESLNVEIKRWLDPSVPAAASKIVKAAFALRNRNGGFLVIGFDDATLQPDIANEPPGVRAKFHQDDIQGLISRYANEPFEVHVALSEREDRVYPVISVPQGVRVPVAVKTSLIDAGSKLLEVGDVYFRTLAANGTPSTAKARPQDWRDILEICFDNREADIGRFLRRQLAGGDLVEALGGQPTQPVDKLRERCAAILSSGEASFGKATAERGLDADEQPLLDGLTWEVALAIHPAKAGALPDRNFFSAFAASNPKYTGWPVWLDARAMTDERSRPVVRSGAWEALIIALSEHTASRLEFFRVDPKGDLYLRRLLQDDAVPRRVEPGTRFDPVLMIYRISEAIAVGLAVAKGLGWDEAARLWFMFRWRKLRGRRLDSWANPIIYVPGGGPTQQDEITTFIEVPLATAPNAIASLVEAATRDLFVTFDGTTLSKETYEEQARRLLERRLGP